MKFIKTILAFAMLFSFQMTEAQTKINTGQSKVTFEVSNFKFRTVKGNFTGMNGEINFDKNDFSICEFNVCIDASSIDTKSKKRDNHLKNEDFFYVEKYPTICFESLSVSKTNSGFSTKGDLTMHGQTREVDIPFSFDGTTFKGELTLDRLDFKVGESVGGFSVGKKVELEIVCLVE